MIVARIVAGGQTGADRGGLDAAIELGIPHGGSCPRGRRAEDGRIPERYHLEETNSWGYHLRTRRNVLDSDATVVFSRGSLTTGSALTYHLAVDHGKPVLHIDLDSCLATSTLRGWLASTKPLVLNVAGQRESRCPGIQEAVRKMLVAVLREPHG